MAKKMACSLILFGMLIIFTHKVRGQSLALPAEGYKQTIGASVSTGVFLNKEAVFWGLGIDYARVFKERWVIDIAMTYDQEFAKTEEDENKVVNTFTPSLALGYVIQPKFVLGLGIGKGVFDDDNENNQLQYNKKGGWTLGLLAVLTLYQKGQHGFDLSGGIEQGLTTPETDLTIELGYGYSF